MQKMIDEANQNLNIIHRIIDNTSGNVQDVCNHLFVSNDTNESQKEPPLEELTPLEELNEEIKELPELTEEEKKKFAKEVYNFKDAMTTTMKNIMETK